MSGQTPIEKAVAKLRNKLPHFTEKYPITRVKDFSTLDFISYTKKSGGQVFQFYSLFQDDNYASTKYTETEVIFSREVFVKKIYHSKIFPISLTDSIKAKVLPNAITEEVVLEHRRAPLSYEKALRSNISILSMYVREVLVRTLNTEKIQISLSLLNAFIKQPNEYLFPRSENLYVNLTPVRIYTKIAILYSDMTSEAITILSNLDTKFTWYSTFRKYSIMSIRFRSNKDLSEFPNLDATLMDPYGSRISKKDKTLTVKSEKAGLNFFLTSYSGTTVATQPYKLSFSFRPTHLDEVGTLLDINDLIIKVDHNTFTTTYKDVTSVVEIDQYTLDDTNLIEVINTGEELRVVMNNSTNLLTISDPSKISPLFPTQETEGYLGNSRQYNDSYKGVYEGLDYIVSDLEALSKSPESLGTRLKVENGAIVFEGSRFERTDLQPIETGDDHIKFNGGYTLISNNREDLSIEYDNNYKIVFEISVPQIPGDIAYFLYQQDKYGDEVSLSIRKGFEATTQGFYVAFRDRTDGYEGYVLVYKIGTLYNILDYNFDFNTKYKIEITKYRNNIFIFVDDVLLKVSSINKGYEVAGAVPVYIGSKYPVLNSGFRGKLYSLEMINYYRGDDRLINTDINNNYITLNFEGNVIDEGNPSRIWITGSEKGLLGDNELKVSHSLSYVRQENTPPSLYLRSPQEILDIGLNDFTIEWVLDRNKRYDFETLVGAISPFQRPLNINNSSVSSVASNTGTQFRAVNEIKDRILERDYDHIVLTRKDRFMYIYINGFLAYGPGEEIKDSYINFNGFSVDEAPKFGIRFSPITISPINLEIWLKSFRVVKNEALFHTIPRYDVDKMQYRPDQKPLVMDSDLLLWLCPSNKEIYEEEHFNLDVLPSSKRVITVPLDTINNRSKSGIEVLEEEYLKEPLFNLKEDLAYYFKYSDITLEFVFKYEGILPFKYELDGLEVGSFYNIAIVKEIGKVFIYVDGIRKKVIDENLESIVLSNSVKYYQIKYCTTPLYKRDYTPNTNIQVIKNLYLIDHIPWYSIQDDISGREYVWINEYDTYKEDTKEIFLTNNENLRREVFLVEFDLTNEVLNSILRALTNQEERQVFLWYSSHYFKTDVHRLTIKTINGEAISLTSMESRNLRFNIDKFKYRIRHYNGRSYEEIYFRSFQELSSIKFSSTDRFKDTILHSNMKLNVNNRMPKELYLKHTDSYNKIPYFSFFDINSLGSSTKPLHTYNSVVKKRSFIVQDDVHLSLPDLNIEKDSLTLEGWFKFDSIGEGEFISFVGDNIIKLKIVSGFLCVTINNEVHITTINIGKGYYIHLRLEFINNELYSYLNGNLFDVIETSLDLIGSYTFDINTPTKELNSFIYMDDFKLNLKVSGEASFNPYLSLFELNGYPQDPIDKASDLINHIESNTTIEKVSIDGLKVPSGASLYTSINLKPYAGYKNNPTCLTFEYLSEGNTTVSIDYINIRGDVLETLEKVITSKEKQVFLPNTIKEESVVTILIRITTEADTELSKIQYLIERPIYEGKELEKDTSYIKEQDVRHQIHYNTRSITDDI